MKHFAVKNYVKDICICPATPMNKFKFLVVVTTKEEKEFMKAHGKELSIYEKYLKGGSLIDMTFYTEHKAWFEDKLPQLASVYDCSVEEIREYIKGTKGFADLYRFCEPMMNHN